MLKSWIVTLLKSLVILNVVKLTPISQNNSCYLEIKKLEKLKKVLCFLPIVKIFWLKKVSTDIEQNRIHRTENLQFFGIFDATFFNFFSNKVDHVHVSVHHVREVYHVREAFSSGKHL